MGKQDIQLRPIIGRPDQVANAVEAQIRAGVIRSPKQVRIQHLASGMVAAHFDPKPAPRKRPADSVLSSMLKALGFVTACAVLALGTLAAAVAFVGPARLIGWGVIVLVVAAVLAWNRINHSGACAGLHCGGCRG